MPPGVGGHHLPCLLQLCLSPWHQQDLPRGSLWDTNQCLRAYCHLIGPEAASQDPSQDAGPQMGHTWHCQAPDHPILLPPHNWQHLLLPCLGLQLLCARGPRQHHHGGAEDARGGPAVSPSSVAQGLHNPLLPVAGVTEAPSGHT